MTQIVLRLTSGTAPIRGMMVPVKGYQLSIYDFLWGTGAYVSKGAAQAAWTRLTQSEYKEEVRRLTLYLKFPGPGQRETPCTGIQGLQRLLCIVGGKIGQQYRDLATTTLTRIAAGDTSLIEEIEDNATSDSPVSQLAREALAVPLSLGDGAGAGEELSEEVLGRIAGTNLADLDDATSSMQAFVEVRRGVITVLTASIPLIERDLQLERERLEVQACAMEHKRKRGADVTAAIAEFLQLDVAHRAAMRPVFMLRMEDAFPNKRARALFCTKLMKLPLPVAAAPVVAVEAAPAPVVVVEAPGPAPAPAPAPVAPAAPPASTCGVYVLQLSNGSQYVGQSRDIPTRVAAHKAGAGAAVASDPDAVQVPTMTPMGEDLESWERIETLERMFAFGIDKVRGWLYNVPELPPALRWHAWQQICCRKGLCLACGRKGHFASSCDGSPKVVFGGGPSPRC